jgi:glycolate oxidase iron-sulfur subunit
LWHLEADSPRGRIFQMIRVKDGEAPVNATFVEHIDKCLDCRACETACPSGVEYGKLVEFARARIAKEYKRPFFSRLARNFTYRWLLPRPGRIAFFASLLRIYQNWGLQTVARRSGVLRAMGLAEREALLPRVDDQFFFRRLGKTFPAIGETRARVAFFGGCVAQVTFAELNEATIRVLTANGCEVTVPRQQVCCGALASHAGDREAARRVARRNLRAFGGDEFDVILTNARRDRVPGHAGSGGADERICRASDLPGFVPLAARAEGTRSSAQAFNGGPGHSVH